MTQRDWEAESDAHTLAEGAAIKANPTRVGRAKRAAQTMAAEQQARATELAKIANASSAKHSNSRAKQPMQKGPLPPMVPPFNPG